LGVKVGVSAGVGLSVGVVLGGSVTVAVGELVGVGVEVGAGALMYVMMLTTSAIKTSRVIRIVRFRIGISLLESPQNKHS